MTPPLTLTRSLLVIILPGLVSVLPWALFFADWIPKIRETYEKYPVLANGTLVGVAVILGSVLEIMVSWIEDAWDRKRNDEHAVYAYWYRYLAAQPAHEPVGFRYLSRKATTLYFELTMTLAAPISLLGCALLVNINATVNPWVTCVVVGFAIGALVFFFINAKRTHLVLCMARKRIIDEMEPQHLAQPAVA